MKNKKINVGVIGLGLIGSSILKGLSDNSDYELFVCSKSSYKKALAYTKNSSDEILILKDCDIVFVCCSLSNTQKTLDELNSILNKDTIVCDVASFKGDLLNKKYNFDFILTHPMAGTEKSGFDAGFKELFNGAKWLVERNNAILSDIISALGAKELLIDMKEHDKLTAQISHLPTILSFLLFDSVDDKAKLIASSGFRDMTRLALSNSDLVLNMFKNEENILKYFDIIIKKTNKLKNMSDKDKIEYFKQISQKRNKMYDKSGKNIFNV
ncbi:MAG: prephenate dehydrogenase [Candidatus Gastranaerophilales bacterium]|nr:prephenate dehydrogenase [Candidatus Gastranaerophilales bacterium]